MMQQVASLQKKVYKKIVIIGLHS